MKEDGTAKWISFSQHPAGDMGVFVFRRKYTVTGDFKSRMLRVSADQRYRFYVNGVLVGMGPQRGDLLNWHFESYDIAPFLHEGDNWIVALVWNFGRYAPMAQHTARQGLVVDVENGSTPEGWEVAKIPGWGFDMLHSQVGPFYIDVGPGEIIDSNALGWGWENGDSNGLVWTTPNVICDAVLRGGGGGGTPWMLVPRTLPAMLYLERNSEPLVRSGDPLCIDKTTSLVLDYEELLTAYPRLTIEGPKGTRVKVTYAESFFEPGGNKGNRNIIDGKEMWGYEDVLVLDGKERTFETLWWRTYRYLRIESDVPVKVVKVGAFETGYPYEVESTFESENTKDIWNVAIRTVKRCAGENYFDCPYYEQLQYVGDTRIQALIGYFLSKDRLLQRNAIDQVAQSVMPDGLTQSRYPSRQVQVIPPFSLWWIMMLYDQWLYDRKPVTQHHLEIAHGIISAWNSLIEGSPEQAFWTFADWVPAWKWGEPPGKAKSSVHIFTKWMAEIALARIEHDDLRLETLREQLPSEVTVVDGLFYHKKDPSKLPSEHATSLLRICQQMVGVTPDHWPSQALLSSARCTYYFTYYKHVAMHSADYLSELSPWYEMLNNGLSTFAESPEPTRSDCHAWSAHPILGFFQIVAGVTSIEEGWRKARIAPRPGLLREFNACIAHPDGPLVVSLDEGRFSVDSPVPFELVWAGETREITAGNHLF